MKSSATGCSEIRISLLLVLLCCLHLATINAQKRLRPSVYNNYIKPNTTVKVQTVTGQRIASTDTSSVNRVELPADRKNIIRYENKIAMLDHASLNKLKDASGSNIKSDEIRVIPELHVEPTSGITEATAYRIVFTLQQPLRYIDSLGKYTARLAFLLMTESGDINAAIAPVRIEVTSNEIDSINPKLVEIKHLSLPSTDVGLITLRANDSVAVKVLTVSNPDGYNTFLKVTPRLEISSNRKSLQGYGIQEIPVTVRFVGSNSSDSALVTFSAEKGTVTPISLYVRYNNPTTVNLRSEGMGDCKLTAFANSTNSNDLHFRFTFPFAFLIFSILGGLAGSFIKPDPKTGKLSFTPKKFLVGIITGIIGAGAYYFLGINLLGWKLNAAFNEIAVFIISALFAYIGLRVGEKVNKK